MKKTAFFQACVIVLLLLVSWLLLVNKLRQPDTESAPADRNRSERTPIIESDPGPQSDPKAATPSAESDPALQPSVPEGWQEWFTYLEEVGSPREMRVALESLKSALFSLPESEAIARLLEFISSGADMKTGLAFQPGPDKQLRGAASLRAVLLDWLHQLDPQAAARVAARELDSLGTDLNPDVYVIHLRNFALGRDLPDPAMRSTLEYHFTGLMEHQPWIDNPGSAIAEAMDIAVYLESSEFVPGLSQFTQPGQAPLLRRAAALALERLVDRRPLEVLSLLMSPEAADAVPIRSRASYMARLDPGQQGARPLLEDYVRSPARDPEEVRFFLQSFPNLNQSLSHNLISTDFSNTNPGGHIEHLDNALDLVRDWQGDPELAEFNTLLSEIEERLEMQTGANP